MLGLVGLSRDGVRAANVALGQAVGRDDVWLLAVLAQVGGELATSHGVDGDVDVVARGAEQLVAHPAAGPAQDDGLRPVDGPGHVDEEVAQTALARVELDVGGDGHFGVRGTVKQGVQLPFHDTEGQAAAQEHESLDCCTALAGGRFMQVPKDSVGGVLKCNGCKDSRLLIEVGMSVTRSVTLCRVDDESVWLVVVV